MNPQLNLIVAQQRIHELRHAAAQARIVRDGDTRRDARVRNPIGPSGRGSFLSARLGSPARHVD